MATDFSVSSVDNQSYTSAGSEPYLYQALAAADIRVLNLRSGEFGTNLYAQLEHVCLLPTRLGEKECGVQHDHAIVRPSSDEHDLHGVQDYEAISYA